MTARTHSLADLAIFAAPGVFVVLWASGFVGAKLGIPYAEPMTFLALRMSSVVLVLGVIVAITRPASLSARDAMHSAATGLLVHGCYLGGVFIAIDNGLPAGLTALVVSLQPILTSTLANRVLGERVSLRQWSGLLLGIVGVYLVVHGRVEGGAPPLAWFAASVGLVGMTLGTLYQRRFGGGIEWRNGFLCQYAAAAVVFWVLAFLFETRRVIWSQELIVAIAWLVFGLSLGAIWLLYFLMRRRAAARVVSLFYLTPPVTALMAWLMFDERLSWPAIAGMAVCAGGVALVNWRVGAATTT